MQISSLFLYALLAKFFLFLSFLYPIFISTFHTFTLFNRIVSTPQNDLAPPLLNLKLFSSWVPPGSSLHQLPPSLRQSAIYFKLEQSPWLTTSGLTGDPLPRAKNSHSCLLMGQIIFRFAFTHIHPGQQIDSNKQNRC